MSVAELELDDPRVEFVADYVLKTTKVKTERWLKLYGLEENSQIIQVGRKHSVTVQCCKCHTIHLSLN